MQERSVVCFDQNVAVDQVGVQRKWEFIAESNCSLCPAVTHSGR